MNPHGTFTGGAHAHRKALGSRSLSGGDTVSTARSSFDKATAVERNGSGRFVAHVDPAWDGPGAPLGGVVMATILRAMTAELDAADLAPRSVTAHFSRPLIHDLVEIQVETLRRAGCLRTTVPHGRRLGGRAASSTAACRGRRSGPLHRASSTTRPAPAV